MANKTTNLKTNLTNSLYQSKFLPIIENAETEIKKAVQFFALRNKSKADLRLRISAIIKDVGSKLPLELIDREKYIIGLKMTSERMIREFYDRVVTSYAISIAFLSLVAKNKIKDLYDPYQLFVYIRKNRTTYDNNIEKARKLIKSNRNIALQAEFEATNFTGINVSGTISHSDIWGTAKGYPQVKNYDKLVLDRQKELAKTTTLSFEPEGKRKPISLWQKAELDIRHEKQLNMIESLKESGVRYAWTSSHPDCSKRCEKWQGKLFDLNAETSELSGHRMRKKLNGNTVYCFNEVINQIDKYGYKNNIIVGFNCRHKLIPYTESNDLPPEEFSAEEIKEQRLINAKLREYERKIRFYKQQALLFKRTNVKYSIQCERKAKSLTTEYKQFANRNGYAYYQYRINI